MLQFSLISKVLFCTGGLKFSFLNQDVGLEPLLIIPNDECYHYTTSWIFTFVAFCCFVATKGFLGMRYVPFAWPFSASRGAYGNRIHLIFCLQNRRPLLAVPCPMNTVILKHWFTVTNHTYPCNIAIAHTLPVSRLNDC